jgi:hypothetical protein
MEPSPLAGEGLGGGCAGYRQGDAKALSGLLAAPPSSVLPRKGGGGFVWLSRDLADLYEHLGRAGGGRGY